MFTMRNGPEYIYCVVTHDALVAVYGASGEEIFLQHRTEIERAASDKFDRPELEPDNVVVIDQADLHPPTSEH
jgi:hypothetical protein